MKSQFYPQQQAQTQQPFYGQMTNAQSQFLQSNVGQSAFPMGGTAPSGMFGQQVPSNNTLGAGGVRGTIGSRVSRVNWRNVNDLDIDEIRKSNDIETLESFLPNLLESVVTQEEYEKLKPEALVKLLQICQLSLQYFDYTQDYLENLTGETQDEINKLLKKAEDDKASLKKSKKEIETMKNEIAIKKEAIKKYKEFLKERPQYKCHICVNKFFQNEEYLDGHMKRRHQNVLPMNANHPNFAVMQNMVFAQQLSQERQEFERQQKLLLNSEKYKKDDVLDKLELILNKNREEQLQQQLEMQKRLRDMEAQQSQLIMKKQKENESQQQQVLELMKNMGNIHSEISTLKTREVVVQGSAPQPGELQVIQARQAQLFEEQSKALLEQQKAMQLETQKRRQELEKESEELKRLRELQEQQWKEKIRKERIKEDQERQQRLQQLEDELENKRKVQLLIGDDNYSNHTRPPAGQGAGMAAKKGQANNNSNNNDLLQGINLLSEIRKPQNNVQNLEDQGDNDIIQALNGIPSAGQNKNKTNNNSMDSKRSDNQILSQDAQANKFNSHASNLILQQQQQQLEHQQMQQIEDEIPDNNDNDFEASSNENDISNDRGFNNEIEEDKERHDVNAQNNKGKTGKQKMATDFSDDEKNMNKSNNNITSKKSLHNQEDTSQNFDESGFYNGSKGRDQDNQMYQPTSLNKGSISMGESIQDQLYSKKFQADKQRKQFQFEDSDDFS